MLFPSFSSNYFLLFKNVYWVQAVIPHCRLYVVGSSLSGFGADWSDVDMCLMVAGRDLEQRTEATAILRILQRELYNCRKLASSCCCFVIVVLCSWYIS